MILFSQKVPASESPPGFPVGPLWREIPAYRASLLIYLFNISFGVPNKGALPPGPPHGVPSERDAPFLELYFIYHSKSPVYKPSLGHKGTPVKRDAHIQSLS